MQTTNISFKGVFVVPSIANISPNNKEKVQAGIKMTESQFPNNDVFFGSDDKGELVVHVQKRNPLTYLLEPEVASEIDLPDEQIVSCVNTAIAMEDVHRETWGEKMPFVDYKTSGIDKMNPKNVCVTICKVITDFNKQFKGLSN